jgi:serine/threonine protein kinase
MESGTCRGIGTFLCRDGRRYRILSHLTEARHGPICVVRDAYGNQRVAKCFRATAADSAAFAREASALEALRHPHVVYLFDAVSDASGQGLILEACNMNLGGWLKEVGRGGVKHFPAIASGVLQALDYIHRRGFLHGDIRPRNILLTFAGKGAPLGAPTIKLTDFGDSVALGIGAGVTGPTFAGGWIFPPETLAPARFGRVDHRTDLFLCALVLLSVLRGKVVNLTPEQVMAGQALELLREIDAAWTPAFAIALDPLPAKRHASALVFWENLWPVMKTQLRKPGPKTQR